ncbi:TUSC5 protein, partial [Polypterus senegalus]|nr:TUSC5 protein [Polypterus senegalus]
MAINTDAHFEKESLGGGGSSLPTDSQETDKLLNAASEAKGENGLKSPDSYSVSMQESDQNGHGMQFRSSSSGQLGDPQLSPSRVSLARASSSGNTAQENQRPRDYLILAILSCFCPIWPVNIVGLVYSIMVSCALLGVSLRSGPHCGQQPISTSVYCLKQLTSQAKSERQAKH